MAKGHYSVDTFRTQNSVGYLIKRLHQLALPRIESSFANEELNVSHWIALISLRDGAATTCAEIARHLGHDTGATTRLIDQLEERGLVTRQRSTDDRRVVRLSLTPSGRAALKALTPYVVEFWNGALEEFSPSEFATLLALLTRLLARVEREPDARPAQKMAAARRRSAR